MNTILYFIALIQLKTLLLLSGSHIVSCFSARAEIPFQLHEIFSDFLARLPGLNPSPCNRHFDFKRICFRSWAEVSTRLTGLKFQPGLKYRHVIGPLVTTEVILPLHWKLAWKRIYNEVTLEKWAR